MNRRKTREAAMKLLFEMTINKENYEEIIENFKEHTDLSLEEVDFEYITRVLKGVEENKETLDKKIEENLKNWKINRLSKVDLSILRICTYEILFEEDIPEVVSINEGIELAKKYSEEKSAPFINGLLANMIRNK
jgi:N utilization substance protein B